MSKSAVNRLQNLAILLLTLSALFLLTSMPIFGPFSDQSLISLVQQRLTRAEANADSGESELTEFVFPVRMVFTNDFARYGEENATTLSDNFGRVGTFLGEALGSAYASASVSTAGFLDALRGPSIYCDFTTGIPLEILAHLLGVAPPETGVSDVRRMLLCPTDEQGATLYVQNGGGQCFRFSTAARSAALETLLASFDGNGADFAFALGDAYASLSPLTLVLRTPPARGTLEVSNALTESAVEDFLRRAEFNAYTAARFTESSGTVIVREASSTLHFHSNGRVDYQGAEAGTGSVYHVSAADGTPTLVEAVSAAQKLAAALLQDIPGSAALYLSSAEGGGGGYTVTFDFMCGGTPIRFSDGSHAAVFSVEGNSITAFSLRVRRYTLTSTDTPLPPLRMAAAIAREQAGAELTVAYADDGDAAPPVWLADYDVFAASGSAAETYANAVIVLNRGKEAAG